MYHDDDSVPRILFIACLATFFLLLTCSGCGADPYTRKQPAPREWDDRLRPHLKTFVHEMGSVRDAYVETRDPLPTVMVFAPIPDGIAGFCAYFPGEAGEIYIHQAYAVAPAPVLQALVAHELGHCVLRADHDYRDREIMTANLPPDVAEWTPERWVAAWDRLAEVAP